MKQTVEEAAKEHQNKFNTLESEGTLSGFINGMYKQSYESFIAGASWQANQSLWISVEERLPEEGQKVLVLIEYMGSMQIHEHRYWKEYKWTFGSDSPVLAWMPIPSFDEILKANK